MKIDIRSGPGVDTGPRVPEAVRPAWWPPAGVPGCGDAAVRHWWVGPTTTAARGGTRFGCH
ncbi:hypothetical protein ABT336_25525, partial [Micromonospora sp. NPDC000207]|uniref:hypothetical protein n=1 Tax=Micromonospora sp. NPDC000207 TaxID=3154246 RepID=UPI00332C790A